MPSYKICSTEGPTLSKPLVPSLGHVDPSAYSIKPFSQVNQNQMEKYRTPETASYTHLDDSKTNF